MIAATYQTYTGTNSGCGFSGRNGVRDALVLDALAFCDDLNRFKIKPVVLEIGCGDGSAALAFKEKGASVIANDRENNVQSEMRLAAGKLCRRAGKIDFIFKPAQELQANELPEHVHVFFSNRTLHWLPYTDTVQLLEKVRDKMPENAKLCISVASFDSPLGRGYPCTPNTPLVNRFATAKNAQAGFNHPVTLYTKADVVDLVEKAGFDVEARSMTDWGMIQVSACRNDTHPSSKKMPYVPYMG